MQPSNQRNKNVSLCYFFILFLVLLLIWKLWANSEPLAEDSLINQRLLASEQIWRRSVDERQAAEQAHPSIYTEPWNGMNLVLLWDFFQPTFNCPHLVERVGRVGDGGKWVCGLDKLESPASCLMYSFGIADDTSFEEAVLNRTNCRVRLFDHTVTIERLPLMKMEGYKNRATFEKVGLGDEDKDEKGSSMKTLKTQMTSYGDKFIDILKVDVEAAEFEVMSQILQDFKNEGPLPFGQLLIEIHTRGLDEGNLYKDFKSWFEALEDAGLRPFYREANLYVLSMNIKQPSYFEYSFLNVFSDHRILHA